ncbi:MAG: hypothetical protein ABSD57_13895 [Verrucomicrobiota bacterium]
MASRLDAEYYQPIYLRERKRLHALPRIRLGQIAFVTDGQHGYHKVDPESQINHVTAKCVVNNCIEIDDADKLALETHLKNKRSALEEGDVILTTAGTVGNAGVVTKDVLPANIDQDVARIHIRDTSRVSPWFLSAFLNSEYGQLQTSFETTGQVQTHLSLVKVRTLEIPVLSNQKAIGQLAVEAWHEHQKSKTAYEQAEQALSDEIGFDKVDLRWSPGYVVRAKAAREVTRIDAEHFQPKYARLIRHLEKTGNSVKLGDIAPKPHRGVQPRYVEGGDVLAVNSRYVGKQFINIENCERTDRAFYDANKRAVARKYDVIMNSTGWGTIGRANCVLHDEPTVVDNHVTIIRPTCNPIYLAVFLNSSLGQLQTNQWLSGSSGQIEIYPADIVRYTVFLPLPGFQQKIADLVTAAYEARAKAKKLLEAAKQKVEDLIGGTGQVPIPALGTLAH